METVMSAPSGEHSKAHANNMELHASASKGLGSNGLAVHHLETLSPESFGMEEEYEFTESIWDAALFIGVPQVGSCGSMFTALAVFINIYMQVIMCLIINDALTKPQISDDSIQDFKIWRTTVAHNVDFVSSITYESLARRVCDFNDSPLSASPTGALEAISEYAPLQSDRDLKDERPPIGYLMPPGKIGQIMCCIALAIWWFTVLKEFQCMDDLFKGFCSLPRSSTVIMRSENGYEIKSLSIRRRCVIAAVFLVRALVSLTLLFSGTLYLASTISVGDLLLNALALEIVLNLDELVFAVLAPLPVRRLVKLMNPLPRPKSYLWHGLDPKPVCGLLFVVALGIVMVYGPLETLNIQLQEAREAICGGNLDFIAGLNELGMVTAFSPARPQTEDIVDSYPYRAIRQLIANDTSMQDKFYPSFGFAGSRFTVQGNIAASIVDKTREINPYCKDYDTSDSAADDDVIFPWSVVTEILADELKRPVYSCADVTDVCPTDTTGGVRARQYCPETCGCNDAIGSLILFGSVHGCSGTCIENVKYTSKLDSMNCTDWSPQSPRLVDGQDLLANYINGIMATEWPLGYSSSVADAINQTIYQIGCAGMAYISAGFGNLCSEDNPIRLRPLTSVCPVACGCATGGGVGCPTTCAR
jgi:hypothetical protein